MPTLALGLRNAGDPDSCRAFGDRLEEGLTRRLVSQPAPVHSFVQTMVLSKHGPTPSQ